MTHSNNSQDRLIDVCLEEVLGGVTPPDLSKQILARCGDPTSTVLDEPEAPPVALPSKPASEALVNQKSASPWTFAIVAASVLLVGTMIGFFAARMRVGKTDTADAKADKQPPVDGIKHGPSPRQAKKKRQADPDKRVTPVRKKGSVLPPQQQVAKKSVDPKPRKSIKPKSRDDSQMIQFVNTTILQSWKSSGIAPAERAAPSKWCRRVHVRLVGRIPLPEEIKEFIQSDTPLEQRKSALVRKLQQSAEYAHHWSSYWTNVLIGRLGGTSAGELASRAGLKRFLYDSLRKKHSYAKIFNDLLTATGSNRRSAKDFNGATNFLLSGLKNKSILATSRTSRVFLGKQLNCVRCHNHPSNKWDQADFWQLNAFFRQTRAERDAGTGAVKLVDRDVNRHVFYEYPNGKVKVAFPSFPGSQTVSQSGKLADVNLRQELAKRISQSSDFSRSLVNRLWSHFFGYGFTKPVDDMGPHNQPVKEHRALLDELAQEFQGSGFDLDRTIRWIVLSDAFALSSRVPENTIDNPIAGKTPMFSHYYARRMDPEDVYRSLLVAARAYKSGDFSNLEKAQRAWLGQFSRKVHGDGKSDTQGDIRQSLIMMTGPLMKRLTEVRPGSVLHLVKGSKMSDDKKIEHLFLSSVARKPTRKEATLAKGMMSKNRDTALQDIWWALLNSTEFVLDH